MSHKEDSQIATRIPSEASSRPVFHKDKLARLPSVTARSSLCWSTVQVVIEVVRRLRLFNLPCIQVGLEPFLPENYGHRVEDETRDDALHLPKSIPRGTAPFLCPEPSVGIILDRRLGISFRFTGWSKSNLLLTDNASTP